MRAGSIGLLVAVFGSLPTVAQAADQVLYVGDSLGVSTSPGLVRQLGGDAQVRGSNRIGRPSGEGLRVLRELFQPSDDVIVFDVGTNDDPSEPSRLAGDLAAARRLTGRRCMVVATLNRPPVNGVTVDGLNGAVLSFVDGAPNVQLVDWNAVASAEPGLLTADRVHASPQGYGVRAQLFAEAVRSCGRERDDGAERAQPDSEDSKPRVRRPRREREIEVPGIESSGISFTEPLEFRNGSARLSGELLLPNVKAPYPAVLMVHGPGSGSREAFRREAEAFASRGVAALIYDRRGEGASTGAGERLEDLAADGRAAVTALAERAEVGAVALWAAGDGGYVAPRVAAADRRVGAIALASPAAVAPGAREAWAVRERMGMAATAAIGTWYELAAQSGGAFGARAREYGYDPAEDWRRVHQPVLATWVPGDAAVPAHASAQALRDALAAGPNRDRTFRIATRAGADGADAGGADAGGADAGGAGADGAGADGAGADGADDPAQPRLGEAALLEQVRWVRSRLAQRPPPRRVQTPLPSAQGGSEPPDITNASFATAPPVQAVWLLSPLVLFGIALATGGTRRLTVAAAVAGLAALVALAAGIADAVRGDGTGVAEIAGVPAAFAVAIVLVAVTAFATVALARSRVWPAAVASALWIALALFWLL